jgi:hypothetical protein
MWFIPAWVYNALTGKATSEQIEAVKEQAATDIANSSRGELTFEQAYAQVSPDIDKIAAANNKDAGKHTAFGINYSGLVPDGQGPSLLSLAMPGLTPDQRRVLAYTGIFGCVAIAVTALRRSR